jgi:hypothetical protein
MFAYFDPAAGDFFFGSAERRRLVVASLSAPGGVRVLPLPEAERWGNDAFACFDPRRGTGVVNFGEETYAIHPDRAELIAKGPRLNAVAFHPQRGELVGFDQSGRYVALRGQEWVPLGQAPAHVRSTMVADPGTGRLACLVEDGGGLALLGETESGWKPLGRRLPVVLRHYVLMSHQPSASLLVWGGYDARLAGSDTMVNGTWVSSSGDFALRASAWHLHLGDYSTPLVQNGRLLIVGSGAFAIHELGAERWEPWPEAGGGRDHGAERLDHEL